MKDCQRYQVQKKECYKMINFNDREMKAMEYLSRSRNFKVWRGIYEKMIRELVDLRNVKAVKDLEIEAAGRKRAAEIIETELLKKMIALSNKPQSPNRDEYI